MGPPVGSSALIKPWAVNTVWILPDHEWTLPPSTLGAGMLLCDISELCLSSGEEPLSGSSRPCTLDCCMVCMAFPSVSSLATASSDGLATVYTAPHALSVARSIVNIYYPLPKHLALLSHSRNTPIAAPGLETRYRVWLYYCCRGVSDLTMQASAMLAKRRERTSDPYIVVTASTHISDIGMSHTVLS